MLRKKFGKKPKLTPNVKKAAAQIPQPSPEGPPLAKNDQGGFKKPEALPSSPSSARLTPLTDVKIHENESYPARPVVVNEVASGLAVEQNNNIIINESLLPDSSIPSAQQPSQSQAKSQNANPLSSQAQPKSHSAPAFDHEVPAPSEEVMQSTAYMQAYNCTKPIKIGQKRKATTAAHPVRKSDEVSISETVQTGSTGTSKSSKYKINSQRVKEKMKMLKKDDDGDLILDKSEFTLANLIYVNRKFGKHKTGLQERRERLEKIEKDRKLQEAIEETKRLEKKQEEEKIKNQILQEKEEREEVAVPVKTENLIGDKDDEPMTPASVSGAAVEEESETVESTVDKAPGSVVSVSESKNEDAGEEPPLNKELSADEVTKRNRAAFNSLNLRTNEKGEMVVESTKTISYPGADENVYSMPATLQENDTDLHTRYKRCFVKKKGIPPTKSRRWSPRETDLFWEGLAIVGLDFTMLEWWFKSKETLRSKNELKSKFHREDKINGNKINHCLQVASKRPLKESDFNKAEAAVNS